MNFNTPIDDPTIINDLLDYDWIIKDFGDAGKWTNCPKHIYEKIKKEQNITYFLGLNPKLNFKNQ
tara:strand:+ start:512 stop:706 length:195 start_codon:yes stop_codon:yes gene_type:complete